MRADGTASRSPGAAAARTAAAAARAFAFAALSSPAHSRSHARSPACFTPPSCGQDRPGRREGRGRSPATWSRGLATARTATTHAGRGEEEARRDRVSPRAVGPGRAGPPAPQDGHRRHEEDEDDELDGDDVAEELRVRAREDEADGPRGLQRERGAGHARAVQARGERGKKPVLRERPDDARTGEDEPVRTAERRDEDRRGHRGAARARQQALGGRRADAAVRRVRDAVERRERSGSRRSRGRTALATSAQPARSATGNVRPGSFTSPPGNVTFVHADCENAGPTSARTNAETRSGGAPPEERFFEGSEAAAGATRHAAARTRRLASFTTVRTFCTRVPVFRPRRVRRGQDEDDERGGALRGPARDGRREDAEELRERDGDGGDRARLDDEHHRPAVEEPRHRAVRLAEEDVRARPPRETSSRARRTRAPREA